MKVIFLDIDFVLNTVFSERRIYCYTFVDTRKVLRLRDIVERTGAQLVLSSTWRLADTPINKICYDALKAEFERVRCPVWVDCTPHFPGRKRQVEIYSWLQLHDEVENFVILDDAGEELTWYWDRLVLTNKFDGLNKERAEFAIKMLGEKSNE
jgi:hypothetical protein